MVSSFPSLADPKRAQEARSTNRRLRIEQTWDAQPIPEPEAVTLDLARLDNGSLQIDVEAPFHGDPEPPGSPGPTEGLWEYEVVELFIVDASTVGESDVEALPRYTEIELSPHGHHLVLCCEGVREAVERCLPLDFTARIDGDRWSGRALLGARLLPSYP